MIYAGIQAYILPILILAPVICMQQSGSGQVADRLPTNGRGKQLSMQADQLATDTGGGGGGGRRDRSLFTCQLVYTWK